MDPVQTNEGQEQVVSQEGKELVQPVAPVDTTEGAQ